MESLYRFTTLAMLSLAMLSLAMLSLAMLSLAMLSLAMLAAIAIIGTAPQDGLIALTIPEIRRLLSLLVLANPPDIQLCLRWSTGPPRPPPTPLPR